MHNLNKLGRGPLGDATYQISRPMPCGSRQEDFFMLLYISLCKTCALRVGSILTSEAKFEQTWQGSTRCCYIPNIKALGLSVSDKKIFKVFLLAACKS